MLPILIRDWRPKDFDKKSPVFSRKTSERATEPPIPLAGETLPYPHWIPAFAGMTPYYVAAVREYSIASAISSSGMSSKEA